MSYLMLPRVHFLGKLPANTPTANNGVGYPGATSGQPIMDPATVEVDMPAGMTPEALKKWLGEPNPQTGGTNAWWNYYGDNGVWFDKTTVTGVHVIGDNVVTDPTEDGLISATLSLKGSMFYDRRGSAVIVDVDPVGAFTTQLFSGQFEITHNNTVLLNADLPKRAYSYWVGWWRNLARGADTGAASVWQIGLPKDGLTFSDAALQGSLALRELKARAEHGQGLVLRMCTYMIGIDTGYNPEKTPDAQNPRPLVLVGTLGVWEEAEMASVPTGRLLYPNPKQPLSMPPDVVTNRKNREYFLSPALAKVDTGRKVVALDLINTIPEKTWIDIAKLPPQDAPEKLDYGILSLCLQQGDTGHPTLIGRIPFNRYNKAAYFAHGGIVDVPYPPELEADLATGDLIFIQGDDPAAGGTQLLSELKYNVVSEDRAVYLEEGESYEVTVRVLERDAAPKQPVELTLAEVVSSIAKKSLVEIQPSADHSGLRSAPRIAAPDATAPENRVVNFPAHVSVRTDGTYKIRIDAVQTGITQLFFSSDVGPDINIPAQSQTDSFLQGLLGFFINVRVLSKEDFSDRSDDFIAQNWDFMYNTVFKYFDILFPRMSQIIDFSNERIVAGYATLIKTFTDPNAFESTVYMPITRDLSPGKRELLRRWCSIQESGG